ncbi:hypothetical protein OAN307_c37940 [Octadecabacter antarcticus 307]|uniref:Uncharacterized protein n=1 Tax=Octadecabacter antarcticus 307 TaxID=391626 RepID=M9RAM3_9RHOB|nr:hypothetical protein OAN307_c37940 [Octadecabacter antarcticus 307]
MMMHKSAAKIKTPRRMARALKPAKLIGTWFAESIRASGQNRANRPLSLIALQSTAGQREHMTASDKCTNLIKYVFLCRSHPHTTLATQMKRGPPSLARPSKS